MISCEADVLRYDASTGKITGVGADLSEVWRRTYPGIDVARQIELAGVWLMENPRREKKDIKRFLGNWLRTAQRDAAERWERREACGRGAAGGEVRVHEGGLLV